MAKTNKFKAEEVIKAIKGSGGVVSVVADRMGCNWKTAKKYLTEYATVAEAWEAEKERTDDMAESILVNNMKLAMKKQSEGQMADTSDARWWLAHRRSEEFNQKQTMDVNVTGGVTVYLPEVDE